jgi:hypothetical protein
VYTGIMSMSLMTLSSMAFGKLTLSIDCHYVKKPNDS